ncbi:hypothetical protein [Erythrobacter alti]|uniref:hypothetical protein n=1 Tax=Erythrobacter alti TaxID=1896145 RepID=UPI0030F3D89E
MKAVKPGPIVGQKPSFVERAARAFSLRRALFVTVIASIVLPLYLVLKTGNLAAYVSPEALVLVLIFAPVAFLYGLFTDRLPF